MKTSVRVFNMKCSEIKIYLSAHLDSATDDHTASIIEDHLAQCAPCRQTLAELQSVVQEVRRLEPATPPNDFLEQLHQRLDSPQASTPFWHKLFRFANLF